MTLPLLRLLVYALSALVGAVLVLGTVVTGSGPHAGDATAKRNGLDPVLVTQLHADAVFLLVGLTVALVVTFAAVRAPAQVNLAVRRLLAVELAQGVVGYVQYFTKLPSGLVEVHLDRRHRNRDATAWLVLSLRERGPAPRRRRATRSRPPRPPGDVAPPADRTVTPCSSAQTWRCQSALSERQPSSVRPRFQ